jgi:nucleoside-diphosphate-sugar epimerase
MKALITGGSGFVGGHLAEQLRAQGDQVRALVRPTSDTRLLKRLGVELTPGDLEDPDSLARACAGCDIVYHSAARVEIVGDESEFRKTTVEGTERLLAAANSKGVRRFIQISSCGVYHPSLMAAGRTIDETTPTPEPPRWFAYARAKYLAEQAVMDETKPPMEWTIVRLGYLYGPRNRTMETYLRPVMNDSIMMLIGDGSNEMAMTYVEDAVQAVVLAGRCPEAAGKILIAGPHEKTTQKEYFDAMADGFGIPRITKRINYHVAFYFGQLGEMLFQKGPRAAVMRRSAIALTGLPQRINCEYTRQLLNWHPTTKFLDGMKKAFEWYNAEYASAAGTR